MVVFVIVVFESGFLYSMMLIQMMEPVQVMLEQVMLERVMLVQARRMMKQGRVYFIKSILSNPFKIINLLYLIFSILPEPILDVVVNTWKALKVKLKIQIWLILALLF